jgi:hypothetical protein
VSERPSDSETTGTANTTITTARQGCVERGEGRGKCHVFLEWSNVCVCGERRLPQVKELK